ncbi:MAG TPA: hypothetical protein VKS81_06305, partial [Bacteroidota bacterium]|nr:hypothetical protein [Bacteroidota bacterium]
FYRHVLIEKRFPHHTAVAFSHEGRTIWEAMKMMGVADLSFNHSKEMYYPTEHPFDRMNGSSNPPLADQVPSANKTQKSKSRQITSN